MFAVAAVAAMSFGITPAFADDQVTHNYVTAPSNGNTSSSSWNNDDCGGGSDNCQTKTQVYNNNPSDKIKISYDVEGGVTCDVDFEWFVNGNSVSTWSRDNYSGTGQSIAKFISVSQGDSIHTETTFSSCS